MKFKFFLIFLNIFIITDITAQSFKNGQFYNEKGQLKVDSNFTITEQQFKKQQIFENSNFMKELFLEIKYPQMYIDAGIRGLVIFALTFDSIGKYSTDIVRFYSKNKQEDSYKPLLFLKEFDKICKKNELFLMKFCEDYKTAGETYYVPIVFKAEFIFEQIKNEGGAIPIRQTIIPFIQSISCPGSGHKINE
jgi:hypothetical protein